jgi:hypothetical protein
MRPRRRKEPSLLTCGEENGSQTAGGDSAGWRTFNSARAPSGGAMAPRCAPVVVGQAGAPPPSDE